MLHHINIKTLKLGHKVVVLIPKHKNLKNLKKML